MPVIPRTTLSLRSAEFIGTANRYLDGRTSDPVVQVGLAPGNLEPFTGARWLVRPVPSAPPSNVYLECLGHIDGPRFLDGHTVDGTVGLAPDTSPRFSGTRWEISDTDQEGVVILRCLGDRTDGENVRFLSADSLRGTVSLAAEAGGRGSPARWHVQDPQPFPSGGPGITSAASPYGPSLALASGGTGGHALVSMAWQEWDERINIMSDVLGSQPFTVSLAFRCIGTPALAFDNETGKWLLAWTAQDNSVNVMSSGDGLVFSGRVQLPGRSGTGPAIAGVHGVPVVAWADADTSELKMVNGLDGPVVTLTEKSSGAPETASAGPALAFFSAAETGFAEEPLVIAWTGTNAETQLNVSWSGSRGFPPNDSKTTLPSDGPSAGTSFAAPSIAFKTGNDRPLMVMSWTGLPGGPDQANHLNTIITGDFRLFDGRTTFAPQSSAGPAVADVMRAGDGNVFIAWTDGRFINTAHSDLLQVIPA